MSIRKYKSNYSKLEKTKRIDNLIELAMIKFIKIIKK